MSVSSYDILGLNYDATEKEIKHAFRTLSRFHHPDRPTGSIQQFRVIERAYRDITSAIDSSKLTHDRMRDQAREAIANQSVIGHGNADLIDPDNFDINKFNRTFEKFRPMSALDHGYDLQVDTVRKASEYDRCLIKYTEPDVILSKGNWTSLDETPIDDYTSAFNAKIKYTDCLRAYATPVSKQELHQKASLDRTIESIQNERDKPIELTLKSIDKFNSSQRQKLERETKRQQSVQRTEEINMERGLNMTRTLRGRL